jgi:hypothetical protein
VAGDRQFGVRERDFEAFLACRRKCVAPRSGEAAN